MKEIARLVSSYSFFDHAYFSIRVYEDVFEDTNESGLKIVWGMEHDGSGSTFLRPAGTYIVRISVDDEFVVQTQTTKMTSESIPYEYNGELITFSEVSDVSYTEGGVIEQRLTIPHEADGSKSINISCTCSYTADKLADLQHIGGISDVVDLTRFGTISDDFAEKDKIALKNNTAAIKTKLIVMAEDGKEEIILTENDSIKSIIYNDERYVPNKGWIGQFVARTIEGELHNIHADFNIENRTINFQLGIVRLNDNSETWYSLGSFIVSKPESDEVTDNTKFIAMDYTKKFNKEFNGDFTSSNFPESLNTIIVKQESYTPLWLAKYTCEQVGVVFGSDSFPNDSFQLHNNPFKNKETCRDVMKEIAKLAFSWVRIDWDNKCYIDFNINNNDDVSELNIITTDEYFTLETQKEKYGPINKVVFGMAGIDGESVHVADQDSIDINGENAIYIYDNPLLDTFDIRAEAIKAGHALFGLTYAPLKTETIGHPWLRGNEFIKIIDPNGNYKMTYPFNKQLKYTGHIRSIIDSPSETNIEATYSYDNEIIKDLRNAMIRVDKQEGVITDHTKRITTVEDGFGNYYTIDQTNELVNTATSGLTNTYTTAGGNNVFKNSGLYFEDENGFEYWEGPIAVKRNIDSASGNSMLLQKGDCTQTVTDLPNGEYTVSFGYQKLNELSTASVIINGVSYPLENQDDFEQAILVDNNSIFIDFKCDTVDGYEVWELMCNKGNVSTPWTQHANEVRTDMVNISKGITIKSSTINTTFKADADGIRIENNDSKETTNFTEQGMETDVAVVREQGNITGALFNKVGNQTWITGL